MDRDTRRKRASRISQRRAELWREIYGKDYSPDTGRLRKGRPFACGCSKKHRGAPRRDRGMCKGGIRHRVYKWRQEAKELNLRVTRGFNFS